jgi:precorrin-3B synthase
MMRTKTSTMASPMSRTTHSAALRRRGLCPTLATPLRTGDGLLIRLVPAGETIALDAFAGLMRLARVHGNGIVEITGRGSIQVRGLTAASAAAFAAAAAALPIAVLHGVPVAVHPLAGLDPGEAAAALILARALRGALTRRSGVPPGPKVSVVVDGGGALTLARLAADIRLSTQRSPAGIFHLALGGDAAGASPLGSLSARHALQAVPILLDAIAARGPDARARDILEREGPGALCRCLSHLLRPSPPPPPPPATEPLSAHRLRDGRIGLGVALAFGHARAADLEALAAAANSAGAAGVRTAPDHVLLIVGLGPRRAAALRARAADLAFLVDPDDPRRRVVACAGAPACASAAMATRPLGEAIAALAAPLSGEHLAVHLSGCAKGCAHQRQCALTLVGSAEGCGIIIGGLPRCSPLATVSPALLRAALGRLVPALAGARRPGEPIAAAVVRLGSERLAALIRG